MLDRQIRQIKHQPWTIACRPALDCEMDADAELQPSLLGQIAELTLLTLLPRCIPAWESL